jgi:hypothetical protein
MENKNKGKNAPVDDAYFDRYTKKALIATSAFAVIAVIYALVYTGVL